MPDTPQINRSLSTIRTELEFLQASKVLSGPQFQSIMAQLPVRNFICRCSIVNYIPSMNYNSVGARLTGCDREGTKWEASTICRPQVCDRSADVQPLDSCRASPGSQQCGASAASESKLFRFPGSKSSIPTLFSVLTRHQHHEWAKNMASRFGSAVMFGAGATVGGNMVNDALKHF